MKKCKEDMEIVGYWNNIKDELDNVYRALQDEESRRLFDARVKYMIDRDRDSYADTIFELDKSYSKNWHCPEIEKVIEEGQKIVIYGCGHDGKILKKNLQLCGYPVAYWCDCDMSLWGTYVEGIEVISLEVKWKEEFMSIVQDFQYRWNGILFWNFKEYEEIFKNNDFFADASHLNTIEWNVFRQFWRTN